MFLMLFSFYCRVLTHNNYVIIPLTGESLTTRGDRAHVFEEECQGAWKPRQGANGVVIRRFFSLKRNGRWKEKREGLLHFVWDEKISSR